MATHLNLNAAISEFIAGLNRAGEQALKTLLETKHLYQKIEIDAGSLLSGIRGRLDAKQLPLFEDTLRDILETLRFTPSSQELSVIPKGGLEWPIPVLLIKNVKLFCSDCNGREVFSPVLYQDATNEILKLRRHDGSIEVPPTGFQLFYLTYQCQRCKTAPEGFIVRRRHWQLFLEGRSPIEHIEMPTFVPKREQSFYRDAVIAMQAGKTLAALFYLRTFIEQFARRMTAISGKAAGDEIMAAYSQTLPESQRAQLPSLRHWYDRLSEAIHAAREDSALFDEARGEIDRHFDIRRVFKIPETPVGSQSTNKIDNPT